MKVVLTGASGFIGARLYKFLIEQCTADQITGDSRSRKSVSEHVVINSYRDCPAGDLLIHLAENSHIAEVEKTGEKYLTEQIEIAQSLAGKFPKVIYLSSTTLYGNAIQGALTEDAEIQQSSIYQRNKRAIEKVFCSNSEAVVLRLSNLYGENLKRGTVLYDIAKQLDSEIIQLRVLNAKRDFLHVDDLCQLIVKVIQSFEPGIFNVGFGQSHSTEELANIFIRLSGISKEIKGEKDEANSEIVIDNTLVSDTFSWYPQIDIESGIREIFGKSSKLPKL